MLKHLSTQLGFNFQECYLFVTLLRSVTASQPSGTSVVEDTSCSNNIRAKQPGLADSSRKPNENEHCTNMLSFHPFFSDRQTNCCYRQLNSPISSPFFLRSDSKTVKQLTLETWVGLLISTLKIIQESFSEFIKNQLYTSILALSLIKTCSEWNRVVNVRVP